MTPPPADLIHTRIWREEAEPDNPFATRAAWCHGYDVYGQMLGQARWVDMLFLLFCGEAPHPQQAALLETLALALANPGPRDASVHAAMCAGVGGSTAASSLIAALAVGAGGSSGGREVFRVCEGWRAWGPNMAAWADGLQHPPPAEPGIWPAPEHPPGFEPYGVRAATPVLQTLQHLAACGGSERLLWLQEHHPALEDAAGAPLAMTFVAATALTDLGLNSAAAEMLYLLLRLPGAAAHALEQQAGGIKQFPFFGLDLVDDPAHPTPQENP